MLDEVGMQDKRQLCCNVNICLCYNEARVSRGNLCEGLMCLRLHENFEEESRD